LIEGEIVRMAPIGIRHEACVRRVSKLLERKVGDVALISVQSSIRLLDNSQPQPDIVLLKWYNQDDYYENRRPTPEDVLLLIEVADTSLDYDRGKKLAKYASSGIPEYWLVNLIEDVIEAYSEPAPGSYKKMQKVGRGRSLPLPVELSGLIQVDDVLGEPKNN
jgi:Uma2 family endonuclease